MEMIIKKSNNLNYISTSLIVLWVIVKEFIRPKLPQNPLLGAFPNFVGGFVVYSLLLQSFIFNRLRNTSKLKNRMILFGILLLLFFSYEEYYPFFTASKTCDTNDIFASGLGILTVFLLITYEISKTKKK